MRIYEIKEVPVTPEHGHWNRVFHISFNEVSIPNYGEFDDWLRRVVQSQRKPGSIIGPMDYYYVLLSHYQGWVSCNGYSGSAGGGGPRLTHFELRCHEPLAKLFLKVYSLPPDEYEKNIKYLRDRENRGRGYFDTNGEVFSYGDVEKLVAAHRSEIRTLEEERAVYEASQKTRRKTPRKPRKKSRRQSR